MRKRKNIILEKVKVEDYAAEGKSLARVGSKVVFIEKVVPGDIVDVKLFKNKKDWAEGYPIHFHEYSKERVDPFCPHFGVCGGCQWQMLPYEKQLQYKQKQVEENLKRIGRIDAMPIELPETRPIIGAEQTKFYRNKLEYTFSTHEFLPDEEFHKIKREISKREPSTLMAPTVREREGAGALGFHAKGVFDKVIDIKTCFLQDEPTNAVRLAVKEFAIANDYNFYDIKNHHGFLRTMQIRICTTGEVMVNVVFAEDDEKKRNNLFDFILKKFPGITTLLYTINTKWNDSLIDLEPVSYFGKGYVIEKMSGGDGEEFQFKIGPTSFFQTNTRQGQELYKVAREFAELKSDEIVYDLYCGTGSIGIFLSGNAKKIIGVEAVEAAVNDAKENAALNNLSQRTEYYAGDVIDICNGEFFLEHGKPDVIVTDPPRAGMHADLVKKILDIAAPIVVYVSCNPATQARDLYMLKEKYRVTKIQPVDMFPHTHHIENVVQLKLK
ncbi:MAG: 23S rRNA (uracil(1939)-C(5))-methyltransferase RlmD [Bacteroidetes bacterium]|nr:MAG: 23S rRNA (uracil(1939)-C(5))-methyltransferase RlmD [Bacteroidota bacterium]